MLSNASSSAMLRIVALAALAFSVPLQAHSLAPLYNPVALNVGINCQWERNCERRELKAMGDVQKFIVKKHPPLWRIHLCNKNARRSAARVDWVGFNDCIRNTHLTASFRR